MDVYEELANAIILQAVGDYRLARKYLKRHPRTKELEEAAASQAAERRKRAAERKALGLPKVREKPGPDERLLSRIKSRERMLEEIPEFFCSTWYEALTTVDGEWLLRKLNDEEV